jgi:hypothetical protein
LPKQCNVGGVTAKVPDEVIHPFKSFALITQTVIPDTFVRCKLGVFANNWTSGKAKKANTIVDRDHDDRFA